MTGTIMNIQKYSVHDGPGIRTTVFLKGCPLKCWWCHNPESQKYKHEIIYFEDRCSACGICEETCSKEAIIIQDSQVIINNDKCNLCGNCTDFCPNNALEYVGRDITVTDLMKEIEKDHVFYEESGGGVTFSGGEPMVQSDFLDKMLRACKEKDIHTAVDTSGYGKWEDFSKILDKVNLFLYDLKLIDNQRHKKYVGTYNEEILDNLRRLSDAGANIFVRMPIIKGINDDDENISATIDFLSGLRILQVNLLPYHKMGMDKYKSLGLQYRLTGTEIPSDTRMNDIAMKFDKAGIEVKIGG
ncbi:trans-4-hydroxy-L-proline dehydratase activase [Vallitalea guaymasensis]|uniref:trans-4-hydroxy-L-proline dehydratase activase n=1 Tax=Vallitalea guaymasensis TaxID=1185412 RepID=UPI0023531089|nr:trans-4-hydroxy-L-proline dehydratase activase [Vallitalea guaymasensis]